MVMRRENETFMKSVQESAVRFPVWVFPHPSLLASLPPSLLTLPSLANLSGPSLTQQASMHADDGSGALWYVGT